jgi:hypothetical protein
MVRLPALFVNGGDPVEVSGWDAEEKFFVERSRLEGTYTEGHQVSLQVSLEHMVEDGAMLFVRAVEGRASQWRQLTPYEAEFAGCDQEGRYQFRLSTVKARDYGAAKVIN